LSPFQSDSIFAQVFSQKKHILDYELNKQTLINNYNLKNLVSYTLDNSPFLKIPLVDGVSENRDSVLINTTYFMSDLESMKKMSIYQLIENNFTACGK
jgi:hypothetical protein